MCPLLIRLSTRSCAVGPASLLEVTPLLVLTQAGALISFEVMALVRVAWLTGSFLRLTQAGICRTQGTLTSAAYIKQKNYIARKTKQYSLVCELRKR